MGWGGERNTPGGFIDDRRTMKRVTSGQIGAVDLGASMPDAVRDGRPSDEEPVVSGPNFVVDNSPITCPNCGHMLEVKVKMSGTVRGD
jgi:hypothetical protein